MIAHERHLLNEPLNALESRNLMCGGKTSIQMSYTRQHEEIHAIMINYCGAFAEAWLGCRHRPPMMISVSWRGERRSRLKWKVLIVKNAHDDEKRHRTLVYFDLWNWDLNETGWAGVCGNVSVFWQLSLVYKRKRIGSYAHNLSTTLPANKSFEELWTSDLKSPRFPLICFYASLMAEYEIWLNSESCRFI